MPKARKGFRFNPQLYEDFKDLSGRLFFSGRFFIGVFFILRITLTIFISTRDAVVCAGDDVAVPV